MTDQTLLQSHDEAQHSREQSLQRTRPPLEVPGFDPLRFLGSGAYGEVWVAVERNTRRKVAIKYYTHRGGLDWSLLSREVEKLAFLFADRYVVQLLDVGWEANPPYYVMEYVEGGSLADQLRAGPMPVREAVALFHDIAVGLVHAHGKGVLHCDLTPGNILVDQDEKPRLADFGQSRMSYEQTPALGTLFYMAPEQADMHAVPDARWDVYALGALLHSMLTGAPPYRTPQALALIAAAPDLDTKLKRYVELLHTAPKPTAHRRVHGVDRDLADIIDHAIAINPSKRYANPQMVLDALRNRAQRRSRRPLLVLGALGPAILLLVISAFAGNAALVSFDRSEEALVARSLESCRFAARFVAFTTGGQINRRWYTLEREARDSELLEPFKAALGKPADSPERVTLQETLEFMHATHPEIQAANWFALDVHGREIAQSPAEPNLVDQDFSYRDYFHGQGHDLPKGTKGVQPITEPHRSDIYVSRHTDDRRLAFSAPIWDSDDLSARQVIGVLGVSVALGHFAELHTEAAMSGAQMAVLVDDLLDSCNPPRRGAILEHPQLAESLEKDATSPQFYVDHDMVDRMQQLRTLRLKQTDGEQEDEIDKLSTSDDYQDPIGGEFQGRWLAAIEPVILSGRPETIRDTGLVVIVQERYDSAVRPARQLAARLFQTSLIALGVVLVVITALWAFVVLVLNESPHLRRAQRRLAHALPIGGPSSEHSATAGTTTGT